MWCKLVEQLFPCQGGSCSVAAAAEDKNEYYVKILTIRISKYQNITWRKMVEMLFPFQAVLKQHQENCLLAIC